MRLVAVDLPFKPGFLYGAQAFPTFGITGENAVTAVDDRGHEVPLAVIIARSLLFGHLSGCRGHQRDEFVDSGIEFLELLVGEGGAGVPLDAACSETAVEVTYEEAFDEIEADKSVAYL